METHVLTPQQIFYQPQQLVVPPFQRPYVWEEEEQWAPFWLDVRAVAERTLAGMQAPLSHFLGAIVLQAQPPTQGSVRASNVIDGQQRLTTLQILMDAAGAALRNADQSSLSRRLEGLTHNDANYVDPGQDRLKLHHRNRDRAAFAAVMDAEPPVDHATLQHAGSRLVLAHAYFSEMVNEWLGDLENPMFARRAEALVHALSEQLQFVVIDLKAQENAQEIFETLNARGTPLTAADLIKNYVFMRLEEEGANTESAYKEYWPFEAPFWEDEVNVGRQNVQRSSLFFAQWLIAQTGEEVGPKGTFSSFKRLFEAPGAPTMREMLPGIAAQAAQYKEWTDAAASPDRTLAPIEMNVYRMHAAETEVLKPLLLWLYRPESKMSQEAINKSVAVAESWIVRRMLCRLPSSDLSRVVADFIKSNRTADPDEVPGRLTGYLSRLDSPSTYWPGDAEVRDRLASDAVYRSYRRGRLRMLLEAVEDSLRVTTNQPQTPRRGYPIEHVLPQKWETSWSVDGEEAAEERSAHVHRLGNLTLLTQSLNSRVSNGNWETKRGKLAENDTLLLNSRLLKDYQEWSEATIDERTRTMTETLLRVWPVPEGHTGELHVESMASVYEIGVVHMVRAGWLAEGQVLHARAGVEGTAVVRADGYLVIGDQPFETPSGGAKHLTGKSTNGWRFWQMPDGRALRDVRLEFVGDQNKAGFDWSTLHQILENLPAGRWTTYGALAETVGTSAQPLGQHMATCQQCANPHRVLSTGGTVAGGFAWDDPEDARDPKLMLQEEGVQFDGDRAAASSQLGPDQLQELIAD